MRFSKKMAVMAIFLLSFVLCGVAYAVPSTSEETTLGKKVAKEVESHWEIISDPVKTSRVKMVFSKLLPFVSRSLPYEVKIIDENSPNAFCIPGGKIYVTSGMMTFIKSDSELAFILAHELTHAEKNHVMIQAERSKKLSLASLALIIATEGQAAGFALAGIAQVAISNSYSRDLEEEADRGALEKVYSCGYSVSGALTSMERLYEEQLKRPYVDPGIFMDHPKIPDRIEYIRQYIKDRKWTINRKKSLNILRFSVEDRQDKVTLIVDGIEIWGSASKEALVNFQSLKDNLNKYLRLETLPYDIRLVSKPERSLVIEGHMMISGPLPEGTDSLESLRESLIEALNKIKKANLVADYVS